VHDAARRKVDSLGIATVYRTVSALVADGWLVQVDLPGEPPRYERSGKTHHHHFVCDECARVYEVNGCPDGIAAVVPEGFRLTRHEVVFYGVCASCAR
jgi:Fur family ferric uptake transcriptional regulator